MLSAMYYHPDVAGSNEKRTKKLEDYAQYRLINFQFDDQFSSGEYRSKLY